MRVAYYLSRFPKLSETFIIREICMLRELGLDVQIFSMLPPNKEEPTHSQVHALLPHTHYSALFSMDVLVAQFYFLFRKPRSYFQAVKHVIWQSFPEPHALMLALILFPKSVLFARQLQKLDITHIHAHFVWVNGIAASVASDLLGIPYSLHAHAWDIFRRKAESVRRQLKLAACVITVSEYHKQYLLSLVKYKDQQSVHIVHYGLDPDEFLPVHGSDNERPIEIISVGRLVEKKGFKFLIDACALLIKKGYAIHCSIIGEGQEHALQDQIERNSVKEFVSLLGAMNITQIMSYYQSSDIFVLPCIIAKSGDRDGMPNVLLEAMAMEIPVVTTPVTGNVELIDDGINGMLVPEADSIALAQAIEILLRDPSLRKSIGIQARKTILKEYDIHHTAAQMVEIFSEM